MKENKTTTIQKLVVKNLMIYLALMLFGVWGIISVSTAAINNYFSSFNSAINITTLDYSVVTQAFLEENNAQVLVLDRDYNVVYESGVEISAQKAFTGLEVTEIVANTNPDQEYYASFIPVKSEAIELEAQKGEFTIEEKPILPDTTIRGVITGQPSTEPASENAQPAMPLQESSKYMLLLQKGVMAHNETSFDAFGMYMMANIICIILFSIIVLLFFIRSIYIPIKANFGIIELNISNAPYDTSPVDVSLASLQESRDVLSAYNRMVEALNSESTQKQKAVEQNRQLVANLAHDLKSPITILKGYSEVLADGVEDEKSQKEYISYIGKSANDLNNLVSLLFAQTKYQTEDNLIFQAANINSILREVCANYYMIFDKRGFEFLSDISEESNTMSVDPVNIKRVFTNLLQNILNHNETPTKVLVSSYKAADCFLIKVKDDGSGIGDGDKEKVFDAFYQVDSSRNSQNSGIGLYVAKQIVEKHGGSISLSSEEEYKTVFTITLK